MSKGTKEEYEDYCDLRREGLYRLKEEYSRRKSRLKLLEAYQITRELGISIPGWILTGLDDHAAAQIMKERKSVNQLSILTPCQRPKLTP